MPRRIGTCTPARFPAVKRDRAGASPSSLSPGCRAAAERKGLVRAAACQVVPRKQRHRVQDSQTADGSARSLQAVPLCIAARAPSAPTQVARDIHLFAGRDHPVSWLMWGYCLRRAAAGVRTPSCRWRAGQVRRAEAGIAAASSTRTRRTLPDGAPRRCFRQRQLAPGTTAASISSTTDASAASWQLCASRRRFAGVVRARIGTHCGAQLAGRQRQRLRCSRWPCEVWC